MGERGEYSRRRRSRRRKGSRSREIFMAFLALMFMAALAVGAVTAVTGGVCGYRYWQGSRTSGLPLEVSREVEAETMREEK